MASNASSSDYDSDATSDQDSVRDDDSDNQSSTSNYSSGDDYDNDDNDDNDDTLKGTNQDESASDETDNSEQEKNDLMTDMENIVWCGAGKKTPVVLFRAECLLTKVKKLYATGEKFHLAYKMVKTECKVIRQILHKHGFHEVHPNSSDFNLMWIGSHVKPYTLRSLTEFQKINHFPRSYEITRKDRLYKNFQRMQHSKGTKHFDFLPQTFITPSEFDDFTVAHNKDKGTWIVKPVASSRGRGIFLLNHPQHLPLDENLVVSRYLKNPLLIDGFKFDLRLYVAITSYDPLRLYLYEEGLARFATVQYEHNNKTIRNTMMHLTNYSVNKKSNDYVKCNDPDIEDYGNKWSLGALFRYLKKQGRDVRGLLAKIEEVIAKCIICAELPVATACKMFMPYRGNCFELHGFDILVDENLKPWILEVNLSPSLACDAPLDLKIKSNLMSDLFSLTGFMAHDPMTRKIQQSKRNQELAASSVLKQQKQRPQSAGNMSAKNLNQGKRLNAGAKGKEQALTAEERRIVLESKEEYTRRGGWMRVFPTATSYDKYGFLLESRTTNNELLHRKLYAESLPSDTDSHRARSTLGHGAGAATMAKSKKTSQQLLQEMAQRELDEHLAQILRKLKPGDNSEDRRKIRLKIRKKYASGTSTPPTSLQENKREASSSAASNSPSKATATTPFTRETLSQGRLQISNNKPSEEPGTHKGQLKQGRSNSQSSASNISQGSVSSISQASTQSQSTKHNNITYSSQATSQSSKQGTDSNQGSSHYQRLADPGGGKPPVVRVQNPEPTQNENQPMRKEPHRPTKKDIRESVNIPELVKMGGDLSKLQARQAFATYLTRVQQRLQRETSRPPERFDSSSQNDDQMDLVLRFLKRAAGNLKEPFKVIVPSRKLQIHDRRRILSKQLGDFVQIYSKETDQLSARLKTERFLQANGQKQNESVPDGRFSTFVTVACENELEELLTTYTKQNKSASIFLGTNSKANPDVTSHSSGSHGGGHLLQRRGSTSDISKKSNYDNDMSSGDASSGTKRPQTTPSNQSRASSSYQSAVPLYSTKITRQRPYSAKTNHFDQGEHQSQLRPSSAVLYRDASGGQIAARHFSEGSEQAIQEALQRLAKRQAARQYSSANTQSLLTQQYSGASIGPMAADHSINPSAMSKTASIPVKAGSGLSRSFNRGYPSDSMKSHSVTTMKENPKRAHNLRKSSSYEHISSAASSNDQPSNNENLNRTSSTVALHKEHKPADAKYNNFVADERTSWQNDIAAAYNTVTGVRAQTNYQPSTGSQQFQYAVQRHHERRPPGGLTLQQKQQISHDMLQQSKAKHQEKIAQAHSNVSALRDALHRSSVAQGHKPKPPPQSAGSRKPISTQRMARTSQLEDGQGSHFYSTMKYSNMTGLTKAAYTSYHPGLQASVTRH
ncbi:tubulin polyglutamylase TTLL5-like isoform X2 [Anneissia japonica]|uniref:tubulin polyglutamylase TTLL5-like isoform X2 n=1 Tax=Anneissia japonica TaxID=1529436 RepID=UPI00142590C8|nr:tubulin polyglutamylase TTLL5-like isoform X2 [Anneissia japonica]